MTTFVSVPTHTDLSVPVAVDISGLAWQASPSPTVWRKTLYRDGGEFGPATSVVRYDADSHFTRHVHPGGEEILVLDGIFSDEHGDYPAGSYLLNPEGTAHTPFSKKGCLLFVRLRQYQGKDRTQLTLDTNAQDWSTTETLGVLEKRLYRHDGFTDTMSLQRWSAETQLAVSVTSGTVEILVLEGEVEGTEGRYLAMSWLRLPPAPPPYQLRSPNGALLYLRRAE
ncbi:MAG: cupin domain-containing protein [Gammaproteobacteria bacterium]|nr:cupin domain-containing protein [Gammaproteobacteria bacterium]